MYNFDGDIKDIKELVAEFKVRQENISFPVGIKIWKINENKYEPILSHCFQEPGCATIYGAPTLGTAESIQKALELAVNYGIPKNIINYEENLAFR
ncbi:MAG: hypothetical protein ACLFQM_06455 [Fidelibacterota bacterium]